MGWRVDAPERGGWAERCSAAAARARAEPEGSDEGESEPTAARERRGGRRDGEKGANQEPPRNEAEPRPSPSRKKEEGEACRPAKGEKGRGERRDRRRLGEHPERRNGKPSRAAAAKGRSEPPRKRARARAWHWARPGCRRAGLMGARGQGGLPLRDSRNSPTEHYTGSSRKQWLEIPLPYYLTAAPPSQHEPRGLQTETPQCICIYKRKHQQHPPAIQS